MALPDNPGAPFAAMKTTRSYKEKGGDYVKKLLQASSKADF